MRRVWVLGSVLGAGLLAMTVMGGQPPGPAFSFPPLGAAEKVADNLYRIPGQGGNTAAWVHGNGVLLVDTKVGNNGKGLIDQVRSVTDKPITHIVNTHVHADHTGSNAEFPANVEIVVQENARAGMERMEEFKTQAGRVGLPDRTYKDRLTLFTGRDAVDLYYFGPAHTNGDTLVVFREARVMHSGDMFAARGMPLVDANNGGSGVAYPDTIAKAVAGIRNVDRVITGHDDTLRWQDFIDYGEFNRLLLEHARASLAAGKTAAQARADLKLPAKFSGYNLAPLFGPPEGNFIGLYAELQRR